MVEFAVAGKKYPLALTVEAMERINEKCGGIENLPAFLHSEEGIEESIKNTIWAIQMLIEEGEENRLVICDLNGRQTERKSIPDEYQLIKLLTPGLVIAARNTIAEAVTESMRQTIKEEIPKNVDGAVQE